MGERVYSQNCAACRQGNGQGIPYAFPPLANSDYFAADPGRTYSVIKNGLQVKVTVNDIKYNGDMPAVRLNDQQLHSVVAYVLNSWVNKLGEVEATE